MKTGIQRKGTRSRNPQLSRERILLAAIREFAARGFAGARVDSIAHRAHINKRMLYHYFGDKEGLFREVLRRKMAERTAWLTSAPDDPIDSLPYWFELAPFDAIYEGCLLRFRPIMMTTMAAMMGTLPIALGFGAGGEARQPLGLAVVGGLIVSQLLTLYITPVVYLYLESFHGWIREHLPGRFMRPDPELTPARAPAV